MQHTRTWTDLYGNLHATFEGRAGGHRWLVAAPPELAAALPAALEGVDGKGVAELLIHDGVVPLLGALEETQPRGVVVIAPRPLRGGPALDLPGRLVTDWDGAPYQEGGALPAWQGALGEGEAGEEGECPAASAAASVGVPVAVTDAQGARELLERWMGQVPHGR